MPPDLYCLILFKLLSKKEKREIAYGHGQQCGDCGEDGGWLEVKEEVRGLNSSGKNIIKKNTLEILTSFFIKIKHGVTLVDKII